MNASLLDPFVKNTLPEYIEYELREDGLARCASFNSKGNLLAVGCSDGRVVIWDLDTREVIKILIGHVLPITSINWSHTGKKLLTTSLDAKIKFWDLMTSNPDISITLNSQILSACFDSKKLKCIACLVYDPPIVIDLIKHEMKTIPSIQDLKPEKKQSSITNTIAVFYDDKYIFTGDSRGIFTIYDTNIHQSIYSKKMSTSGIKGIIFSNDKKRLLLNCGDKVIRAYDIGFWDNPIFELNDAVNKLSWKVVRFTSDDEYIIGGSAEKHEHKIYIWNNPKTSLNPPIAAFLEGPMEGIFDLVWHPIMSTFASVSSAGTVYVWCAYIPERWSAFAPGFIDLKQNVEYIEREDEFDIVDEKHKNEDDYSKIEIDNDESQNVDIVSIDKTDSENEENFYLPVSIIPDKLIPTTTITTEIVTSYKQKKKTEITKTPNNRS